jgi:predicted MPP superfamily phosphohydrolase
MSYRYISGLYERVSASGERVACIVGNGTGNWFPLRVQAPAEIVRVVLRRS